MGQLSVNWRAISAWLAVGLLLPALCQGEPPAVAGFTLPAKTTVPYTYCIWYRRTPDNETFLNHVKASPPDLFHLGFHIPFKGALGPTYGHDLFTDKILGPKAVPLEVARDKAILAKMRAAGVGRLIPYVYTMAFFGNPDRRTGFFRFFDHWDDYAAFGIGPKPDGDPTKWLQAEGPKPLGGLPRGSPRGVLHYQPCVNNPAWSAYLDFVVRQLARAGYDGMFHDVNTQCCFCPYCQARFRLYLSEKYGPQGLLDAFGTSNVLELNLSKAGNFEDAVLKSFPGYLAAVWRDQHLDQVLGMKSPEKVELENDWHLLHCYMQNSRGEFPPETGFDQYLTERFGGQRIQEVAKAHRKDFVETILRQQFRAFLDSPDLAAELDKQFGSADIRHRCLSTPRDLLLWVETQRFWCDSMAATLARLKRVGRQALADQGRNQDFYTVANLGPVATLDCLNKRRLNGIDLARWARSSDMQMFEEMQQCGTLDSGVILSNIFAFRWAMAAGTRGGTLLYMVNDDRAADLAEAEVAGGGGGAFIQPAVGAPESRKRWKKFYADHADLWDSGTSCARVGLLFWNDQLYYEHSEHLAMTRRLVSIFSETQIPFDIVTEENLGAIGGYQVIIAPSLRYLDDTQIESLLSYAQNGGKLVIIEPFATEDKWARPRTSGCSPLPPAVLLLRPEDVPARSSDFWNLMEDRANHFAHAREFLEQARRNDTARGIDLGPAFVRNLEESLQVRLRWCPPETDPAVYVHAYRIPAKDHRNERIVVHVVNYHMPILLKKKASRNPDISPPTKSGPFVVSTGLKLTVPMPNGWRVAQVEAFSPTEDTAPIRCSIEVEGLELIIPKLRIYQGIVIDLLKQPCP